jgi:hypothetical protein
MDIIVNRGTGAGGANTNKSGLAFEKAVSNEQYLISIGFKIVKVGKSPLSYYLVKDYPEENRKIYFAKKKGFKCLAKMFFGLEGFKEPDEAFITHNVLEDTFTLHIIEVKNQNREGSVEEKINTANVVRRNYKKMFDRVVDVHFAFTISDFLKNKLLSNTLKYSIMRDILEEDNIKVFFGTDEDYLKQVHIWVSID